MHYLRLWRHGSTNDPRPTALQRFWSKVDRDESDGDACWTWIGTKNAVGYGRFKTGGRKIYAHRFAYETFVGPIPADRLQIDHRCNNPSCVNPDHLAPATPRENTLRGNAVTAINARKTHCPRSHPYAGPNLYVKPNGDRCCRACRALANHRRAAARAGQRASRTSDQRWLP